MARIRFQMFLDEGQKEDLEILHKDSNIAIAEIIRRAIDNYLSEYKKNNKITTEEFSNGETSFCCRHL